MSKIYVTSELCKFTSALIEVPFFVCRANDSMAYVFLDAEFRFNVG